MNHKLSRISDSNARALGVAARSVVTKQLQEFAVKVGEGTRATSLHAVEAETALRTQLEALENDFHGEYGHPPTRESASDYFAAAMQGSSRTAPATTVNQSPAGSDVLGQVDGVNVTLSDLISLIWQLESDKLRLEREIEQIKASLGGGVKVGGFSFDLVEDVIKQLVADGVDPKCLATHVDMNSLFVHYPDGSTKTSENSEELKLIKAAGVNDPVCLYYLATFKQEHLVYLQDGKGPVGLEARFPIMLNDKLVWEGQTVLNGGRAHLKTTVKDAFTRAKVYIADNLPAGSITRKLALAMAQASYKKWWINVSTFFDDEILELNKYGISKKEVFGLVSDELKVMCHQIFMEQMWI